METSLVGGVRRLRAVAGNRRAGALRPGGHSLKFPLGGPIGNVGRELLQQTGNGGHRLGPMQTIDVPMRHFGEKEVDCVIVGVGAGGGVMLQRLARAGYSVVGFDAGPFWDSERDWVSDEEGSHNLYWEDLRIIGGKN